MHTQILSLLVVERQDEMRRTAASVRRRATAGETRHGSWLTGLGRAVHLTGHPPASHRHPAPSPAAPEGGTP